MEAVSSANVRMAIYGRVTGVSLTGNVTMTQARVAASEVSPQMDTVSQYTVKVSFIPYLKFLPTYLTAIISCTFICFCSVDYSTCPPPTGKTSKTLVDAALVTFQRCFLQFCWVSLQFFQFSMNIWFLLS